MTDKAPKQRDLDHLIEQNSTELGFLNAYGGTSLEGDGGPLLSALTRFLKAGNVDVEVISDTEIGFGFGTAGIVENGCKVVFEGTSLPLVQSDVQQAGFAQGMVNDERTYCELVLIEWGFDQRRFIERMSEHLSLIHISEPTRPY